MLHESSHHMKAVGFLSLSHPALLSSDPVLLPPHHLLHIIRGALTKTQILTVYTCAGLIYIKQRGDYWCHKESTDPEKMNETARREIMAECVVVFAGGFMCEVKRVLWQFDRRWAEHHRGWDRECHQLGITHTLFHVLHTRSSWYHNN